MLNEVRIIVTEADAGFRQGLTQLLGQQDAFEIVDDLDTGRDTVVAVRELEPDLLLLDMELKDMPGLDVLRQIGGVGSLHTVAMVDKLSVHEMTQALLLGACGAVEKSAKSPALLKCIRAVLAGDLWFQRDVTKALL